MTLQEIVLTNDVNSLSAFLDDHPDEIDELFENSEKGTFCTALHTACEMEEVDLRIVEILVDSGANIYTPNNQFLPPVFLAARNQRADIIGLMLERGFDPNFQAQLGTLNLLKVAVVAKNLEMVRTLLQSGADPAVFTGLGLTPIKLIKDRKSPIRALLLEYGAQED